MRKNPVPLINLNRYHQAEMITRFVFAPRRKWPIAVLCAVVGVCVLLLLFRIEPEKPYPAEYTPCTEVAKTEKEADARPAIKNKVENWEEYDTVFIGCPVWWWTAPMIIHTFAESYDFNGKTVVPFCTYAATYRDETLARIVELTPAAEHLKGFGTIGKNIDGVESWLRAINVIR